MAKQCGVQFPDQHHSVLWAPGKKVCGGIKRERTSLETVHFPVYLLWLLLHSVYLHPLEAWSLKESFVDAAQWAFFPSLFPPLTLSALRAGGETMIKSSWFYVKFKYTDKVSQSVFFSLGKPASPPGLMLTALPVTLKAKEPGSVKCECVFSGFRIPG